MSRQPRQPLCLRTLDPLEASLTNKLLVFGARQASVQPLDSHVRYLELEARMQETPCAALIPLQQVLDHWLGDGAIPVEAIDLTLATAFVRDAFREYGLPSVFESIVWVRPRGIVTREDVARPYFLIEELPIQLFLDVLPVELADRQPQPLRDDIPLTLACVLGPINLPTHLLANTNVGDILRLHERTGWVTCASARLFQFTLTGDHIVLDTLHDPMRDHYDDQGQDDPYGHPVGALPHDHNGDDDLGINDLPVPVSVVVARQTLTVSELADLHPGSTLPLSMSEPLVTLMIGNRPFARGELVRIGDELGVELRDVKTSLLR
jgi:flagellar motor switch/type III secretory pathway protein FliN